MDEVDYSQFLYRPGEAPKEPKPEKKRRKNDRPDRGKGKRAALVVIVVLLCFSLLFMCVDFFAKGKVTKGIYSLISKAEYEYYLVAASYPTRDMAHAGALLAENAGGAGYLFAENGDYFVVFGVYTSQPDAQKVIDRNGTFFLYTLSFSTANTDLANLVDGLVRNVSVALDGMDAGTFTESGLQTVLNNYVVLFSAYETDGERENALKSFVLSCLNGLDPGITERTSLLFRTRHMLCSVLFSSRETFA